MVEVSDRGGRDLGLWIRMLRGMWVRLWRPVGNSSTRVEEPTGSGPRAIVAAAASVPPLSLRPGLQAIGTNDCKSLMEKWSLTKLRWCWTCPLATVKEMDWDDMEVVDETLGNVHITSASFRACVRLPISLAAMILATQQKWKVVDEMGDDGHDELVQETVGGSGQADYDDDGKVSEILIWVRVRLALRTLTSTPCNTSTAALHKLLQVEPFKHRATELNLMWSSRLHNSTDCSIPAVRFWRGALLGADKPFQECLPRLAHSNPLVTHVDAKWIDFRQQPLVPPPPAEVPFRYPPKPKQVLSDNARKKLRKESIVNLDNNPDTIAGAIQVQMKDPIRPYLTACKGIDRKTCNNILRWTLGAVTRHEPCLKCNDILTRSHAVECSGAAASLLENWETPTPPAGRMTLLDTILNE
ncbi:hypothetical protein HDU81_003569, partial [Chytriomyces hyalinus]